MILMFLLLLDYSPAVGNWLKLRSYTCAVLYAVKPELNGNRSNRAQPHGLRDQDFSQFQNKATWSHTDWQTRTVTSAQIDLARLPSSHTQDVPDPAGPAQLTLWVDVSLL